MPILTESQLNYLLTESKELWLWMEEYRIGHKELYRKVSKYSGILKISAVIASLCTIISTFPGIENIYHLTSIAAIFTACITSLNQYLSPEKKQQIHWDIIKKIEINQKELASNSRGFSYSENFEKESFYIQRLRQSISQFLSPDIDIKDKHKSLAKTELAKIKFASNTQPKVEEISDLEEGMMEDVTNNLPKEAVRERRAN